MVTGEGEGGARISPSEALCNCSLNVPSLEDDEREDEEEDEEEEGLWIAGGSNGKMSSVPLNKEVASAAAEALARELESKVDFSVSGSLAAPPCSSAKPLEEGAKSLEELILVDPIWAAMRAEARLESYRVAHALWARGQNVLALALQSRISEVFGVDIHPAAKIGKGVLLDHATGVVIGETAVVGNRVSIMQGVTLGGTGREIGDRHPKIGHGSLIGASATILGNIKVGKCAVVTAGSLVLKDVPAHSIVAGIPAKVIGYVEGRDPSLTMEHDASKEFFHQAADAPKGRPSN